MNGEHEHTTSERKVEANRQNAQKSTGPKTGAGKEIVSRNALKHGLLAKGLMFDNEEEKAELELLRTDLQEELAPEGVLERILVEEIVASWWKVQRTQRWSMHELRSRRRAAISILQTFAISSGVSVTPTSDVTDAGKMESPGWDCRELTIKVDGPKSEEDIFLEPEPKPTVQFEAKLSTSAETFLRYEVAWKKDMYRALETLKKLQQTRLAKSGGSTRTTDSPNKTTRAGAES
jgi:hypothetical protein